MEAMDALFNAVYDDDLTVTRRLVRDDPALARARNADTLSVLQFARFMRREEMLEALIVAGPPLDLYEAASIDGRSWAVRPRGSAPWHWPRCSTRVC